MRRKDREMDDAFTLELLTRGEFGVLSLAENTLPYGVPVNYVLIEKSIYFHCALAGKKIDIIKTNSNYAFTVVGKTEVVPHKFTSKYECAMAYGKSSIVKDNAEKRFVLVELCKKYSPGLEDLSEKTIEESFNHTAIVKLDIESMSGKANKTEY